MAKGELLTHLENFGHSVLSENVDAKRAWQKALDAHGSIISYGKTISPDTVIKIPIAKAIIKNEPLNLAVFTQSKDSGVLQAIKSLQKKIESGYQIDSRVVAVVPGIADLNFYNRLLTRDFKDPVLGKKLQEQFDRRITTLQENGVASYSLHSFYEYFEIQYPAFSLARNDSDLLTRNGVDYRKNRENLPSLDAANASFHYFLQQADKTGILADDFSSTIFFTIGEKNVARHLGISKVPLIYIEESVKRGGK